MYSNTGQEVLFKSAFNAAPPRAARSKLFGHFQISFAVNVYARNGDNFGSFSLPFSVDPNR